jgi:hypothetical protein
MSHGSWVILKEEVKLTAIFRLPQHHATKTTYFLFTIGPTKTERHRGPGTAFDFHLQLRE